MPCLLTDPQLQYRLLDHFHSYYGGLISVCWSPDGKYVLTGGQDDLISIWHVPGSALIARCQGHRSWVTSVAFDPWRCDDKNYRFGSVGEDRRLCLWDFSVGMLHRPRGAGAAPTARHGSVASRGTALARAETQGSELLEGGGADGGPGPGGRGLAGPHPVKPRASTAMLPPVLSKVVDADPLAWLEFTEDAIMTSCKSGTSSPPQPPTPKLCARARVLDSHFASYALSTLFASCICALSRSRNAANSGAFSETGMTVWLTVSFSLLQGTSAPGTGRRTRRPRSVRPRRVEGSVGTGTVGPIRTNRAHQGAGGKD